MNNELNSFKNFTIIYGFDDNIYKFIENNTNIILIEPRKHILDYFNNIGGVKKINSNIILIKKCLAVNLNQIEKIIYENTLNNNFIIDDKLDTFEQNILQEDLKMYKKHNVFITSLKTIITNYNIQNIKSIVINFNISNIFNVLHDIINYNQIISHIFINNTTYLDYFKDNVNKEKCILHNFTKCNSDKLDNSDLFYHFEHKNLNITLPNIAMYCQDNNIESQNMKNFIKQYCITPINVDLSYNIHSVKKSKTIMYEWLKDVLDTFFTIEKKNEKKHEIFFIFNHKYLENNNVFPILYPLQNDILYINKEYDIIYGSKNCMYMLYEVLNSDYFLDYMNNEKLKRKNLFYIFAKNIFYNYISKIFIIKETF